MTDRRTFSTMLGLASAASMAAQDAGKEIRANLVHQQALPLPFLGWEARFVAVDCSPGVRSKPHHHPGFVLGYVIEGEFRLAINGEEPRVLKSGAAFYEPPGANHTAGDSASAQRPARILAIIIAPVDKS